MEATGGCLCGRLRYGVEGEPGDVTHCYCSLCRRHGGSAYQTFARFRRNEVRWEGAEPSWYRSSSRAERAFCPSCGSSLGMRYDNQPAMLWLTAGTLDHPELLRPTLHWCLADRLPWVPVDPELPAVP